jgi:hypothetical protein
VNLRNREDVTVRPVEPPAIAGPLAELRQARVTGRIPAPFGIIDFNQY